LSMICFGKPVPIFRDHCSGTPCHKNAKPGFGMAPGLKPAAQVEFD
jgi:hypothetical protein